MIMVPLTRIAKHDTELFVRKTQENEKLKTNVLRLKFDDLIPESHWPEILHWSEHNMTSLFDIGYQAGIRFFEQNETALTRKTPATVTPIDDPWYKMAA